MFEKNPHYRLSRQNYEFQEEEAEKLISNLLFLL